MCVSCLYIRLVPKDAQRECCTLASKYSSSNKVVVDAELADENPALLDEVRNAFLTGISHPVRHAHSHCVVLHAVCRLRSC
jgi:hypothetical protein